MDFLAALGDLLGLLGNLVRQFWMEAARDFAIAAIAGMALAAFAWWLASYISFSFNREFSFHPQHHVYCAIAAAITLLSTLLFASLRYTAPATRVVVKAWESSVRRDHDWSSATFRAAYERVHALRDTSGRMLEDFTDKPHPDTGVGTRIPLKHRESKLATASTFTSGAVEHFEKAHPFLSWILQARSGVADDLIVQDMDRVFASGASTYQIEDAVALAGKQIRLALDAQVRRVVIFSRGILIVAFLLVQAITIALLIRASLADIKESGRYGLKLAG